MGWSSLLYVHDVSHLVGGWSQCQFFHLWGGSGLGHTFCLIELDQGSLLVIGKDTYGAVPVPRPP